MKAVATSTLLFFSICVGIHGYPNRDLGPRTRDTAPNQQGSKYPGCRACQARAAQAAAVRAVARKRAPGSVPHLPDPKPRSPHLKSVRHFGNSSRMVRRQGQGNVSESRMSRPLNLALPTEFINTSVPVNRVVGVRLNSSICLANDVAEWCSGLYNLERPPCPVRSTPLNQHAKTCRPDFFILGTRKGGTTSMYNYIAQHPRVWFEPLGNGRIEPQRGENPHKIGMGNYNQNYGAAPGDMLVGDAQVSRLVNDASSIFRSCSTRACGAEPRMITLLREPIDRCLSLLKMRHRLDPRQNTSALNSTVLDSKLLSDLEGFVNWSEIFSLDRHLQYPADPPKYMKSPSNMVFESAYIIHLALYAKKFQGGSMRIYWSEEFFDGTKNTEIVKDALSFIGVNPADMDVSRATANAFNSAPVSPSGGLAFSKTVRRQFEQSISPFNKALSTFLGAPLPCTWKY